MTDATLGTSDLWLGTRTGAGGTATITKFFFFAQSMPPWTTGHQLKWNGHVSRMGEEKKENQILKCLRVEGIF